MGKGLRSLAEKDWPKIARVVMLTPEFGALWRDCLCQANPHKVSWWLYLVPRGIECQLTGSLLGTATADIRVIDVRFACISQNRSLTWKTEQTPFKAVKDQEPIKHVQGRIDYGRRYMHTLPFVSPYVRSYR